MYDDDLEAELILQHFCYYYQLDMKVGNFLWEKQHEGITLFH